MSSADQVGERTLDTRSDAHSPYSEVKAVHDAQWTSRHLCIGKISRRSGASTSGDAGKGDERVLFVKTVEWVCRYVSRRIERVGPKR
jgi:hypothetical protein